MKRIKEKIGRTMATAGIIVVVFGAAAMDSQDLRYPFAIMAAGAITFMIGTRIAPIVIGECEEDWDEI